VTRTERASRPSLWTLVSVAPIIVLCGVLLYAYVIRPRLQARAEISEAEVRMWGSEANARAGEREMARIRAWLLDVLSEEQRRDLHQGRAQYEVDLKDLPEEIRGAIAGLLDKLHPGGRLVGGKIEFLPKNPRPSSAVEAKNEIIQGHFELGGRAGGEALTLSLGFPGPWRTAGRFEARPEVVRRMAREDVVKEVSREEFERWWEWAETNLRPVLGPRQEPDPHTQARDARDRYPWASSGDLTGSEKAETVLNYLLEVLPRPRLYRGAILREPNKVACAAYFASMAPDARMLRVTADAYFAAPGVERAVATFQYTCKDGGQMLFCLWVAKQQGTIRVRTLMERGAKRTGAADGVRGK
jgi:hypothetical protein